MPRQLVIFDFDGTLADTWRDIRTAPNSALDEAGLQPVSGQQVQAWIGNGVVKLVERAVPDGERTRERIAALATRYRVHYDGCCLDTTTLYPGIAQCLADLSVHTLAVLSNKPTPFLERLIERLGLGGRFAAVIGGDMLQAGKPDPAAVDHVVRIVGGQPGAVWMIGDSAIDIAAGRGAGAHTIGCAWGLRGAAELREAHAEFLVEHPSEIPPLLESRCARAGQGQGQGQV